jgi:flagellar export protein FliJ
MTTDLRRFEYALEPVRQQRRWTLDALQAELGRIQRKAEEAEAEVAVLRRQLDAATAHAARSLATRVDPAGHPRALGFLVQLREAIAEGEARVRTLHAERERVRAACVAQQQKVDVIEQHREKCVAEFAQAEEARGASEADRDWLSRREWATVEPEGKR